MPKDCDHISLEHSADSGETWEPVRDRHGRKHVKGKEFHHRNPDARGLYRALVYREATREEFDTDVTVLITDGKYSQVTEVG
jgi:hypothetical protein